MTRSEKKISNAVLQLLQQKIWHLAILKTNAKWDLNLHLDFIFSPELQQIIVWNKQTVSRHWFKQMRSWFARRYGNFNGKLCSLIKVSHGKFCSFDEFTCNTCNNVSNSIIIYRKIFNLLLHLLRLIPALTTCELFPLFGTEWGKFWKSLKQVFCKFPAPDVADEI